MSDAAGLIDWIQASLWNAGEWQLRGVLLVLVVWLSLIVLRTKRSAQRVVVWEGTLIALLIIPLIGVSLPRWQVLPKWAPEQPVPLEQNPPFVPLVRSDQVRQSPIAVTSQIPLEPNSQSESANVPMAVASDQPVSEKEIVTKRPARLSLGDLVFWVWIGGLIWILTRVLLGLMAVKRFEGEGQRVRNGVLNLELQQASEAMGVRKDVPLYLVKRELMPMTVGAFSPKLFLPDSAQHWPEQRVQAVMRHEMAHIKRRDCLILLFAQLACAFHWCSPFAWLAKNQWIREREQVCDDHVLDSGVSKKAYASALLELGTRVSLQPVPGSAAVLSSAQSLEPRIDRILDQSRHPSKLSRHGLCLAMCTILGLGWAVAAVDSLILSEPLASNSGFSRTVSEWAMDGIRENYPSMASAEVEAVGAHLETFFNGVLATNTVSDARKTQLLETIETSIAKQFDRGGPTGLKSSRPLTVDRYGRQLSDMTLQDDVLTVKWKLWRALTMPDRTETQKRVLTRQHQILNGYLLHREQLIAAFLATRNDSSSLAQQLEKDQYDWRCLREWILLQQSYSDPLGSVFDRPLSDEDFGGLVEALNEFLERADAERSRESIDELPTVRHIGAMIRDVQYPIDMISVDFRPPFVDRVARIDGPRSWDDPVHLRLTFDSNHPERYNSYSRRGEFRVVPPYGDGKHRLGIRFGIGSMYPAVDVEMAANELDHAGGGNPQFLVSDDGFGRDILSEIALRSGLSTTEQGSVRAALIVEKIEDVEALGDYALSSSIETERSGIAKILALWRRQQKMIASYENVLLSLELPSPKRAILERLIEQMKANTINRLFSVRERFSGVFEEGLATTWGVLRSNQGWNGTFYSERFRIADYNRFPVQIEGEVEPAFFGRFVRGNDDTIVLDLEPIDGAPSPTPSRLELVRRKRLEMEYLGGRFHFLFASAWTDQSSEERDEAPFVHLRISYFPNQAR